MEEMVLHINLGEIFSRSLALLGFNFPMICDKWEGEGECHAAKWWIGHAQMDGFSQRGMNLRGGKNCPTREYADFSLCLLETQIFFFDSHAMRTTFSVRCHASRVENWSLIYWIIKRVYFRSSSLLDFTPYMMCGLMHFASKGKTISSTNPWSTHAVDLAPKADPTTPRIPLGLWAIKVTGEGLNSKFASRGEKRLYE